MKLAFTVRMLSDFHIGAGFGNTTVDSVVARDAQGLPFIPGTTIAGLLRKGLWNLLKLDQLHAYRKCARSGNEEGPAYCTGEAQDSCPLCRILGTPARSKKWQVSSGAIDDPKHRLPSVIRWRNKVNKRTRTAETRKLFNQEYAPRDLSFQFTVSNVRTNAPVLEEAAIIVAAFRTISHVGSSIHRGKGLCEFSLHEVFPPLDGSNKSGVLLDQVLDIFKERWLEGRAISPSTSFPVKGTLRDTPAAGPLARSFTLVFLAREPVVVSTNTASGNIYTSKDLIPGQTLSGALAWQAARVLDMDDQTLYDRFLAAFRDGGLRVSPLYPALSIENDLYPCIPSPLEFLSCKLYPITRSQEHYAGFFADIADGPPAQCTKCAKDFGTRSPLKPVRGFKPLKSDATVFSVNKQKDTHTRMDLQKGITVDGDLFQYVAIQPGQFFLGEIDVADWHFLNAVLQIEKNDFMIPVKVGKATGRGYGLGTLYFHERVNSAGNDSAGNNSVGTTLPSVFVGGLPLGDRVRDLGDPIVLTALSDLILEDEWGRYLERFEIPYLSSLLGIEARNLEICNQYVRSRNVDGFNVLLGLPKWRERALVAGSTVAFRLVDLPADFKEDSLLTRLETLEARGIGVRRAEGYGRLAFNHPVRAIELLDRQNVSIRVPSAMRLPRTRAIRSGVLLDLEQWREQLTEGSLLPKRLRDTRWDALAGWIKNNAGELARTFNPENLDEFWMDLKDRFKDISDPVNKAIEDMHLVEDRRDKYFIEDPHVGGSLEGLFQVLARIDNEQAADLAPSLKRFWRKEALFLVAEQIHDRVKKGGN